MLWELFKILRGNSFFIYHEGQRNGKPSLWVVEDFDDIATINGYHVAKSTVWQEEALAPAVPNTAGTMRSYAVDPKAHRCLQAFSDKIAPGLIRVPNQMLPSMLEDKERIRHLELLHVASAVGTNVLLVVRRF